MRHSGLIAALLAICGQLLLGMAVPRSLPDPVLTGLLGGDALAICHVGSGDDQPTPGHAPADCLLCPLCVTLAQSVVLPAPPAPRRAIVRLSVRVPRMAVVAAGAWQAARPRGPPARA